jgi:peptide/nickel transport system ATP-binding protein
MSLLSVRNLKVTFSTERGAVHAVNDVSFDLDARETVGLVGESGCGKSTLGKAVMRLVPISDGAIFVNERDITTLSGGALKEIRPRVQMIFQDPYSSLNPRRSVGSIIGQPLQVAGRPRAEIRERVHLLMRKVGLLPEAYDRYPHEFSGGQRQRIGIARALVLEPEVLICDEPVSALDVSVRAQVINLLDDLQQEFGISYLFISHDLSVVEHIADRLMVMYLGRIMETGPTEAIWRNPAHPYTRALLLSAPLANPKAARQRKKPVLQGELPSPLNPPSGCAFHTRCTYAQPRCSAELPLLRDLPDRKVACHFDLPPANSLAADADAAGLTTPV